jgi:hypothetical protein
MELCSFHSVPHLEEIMYLIFIWSHIRRKERTNVYPVVVKVLEAPKIITIGSLAGTCFVLILHWLFWKIQEDFELTPKWIYEFWTFGELVCEWWVHICWVGGGGGRDFMEHFLFWQELLCSYVALIFLGKKTREFWIYTKVNFGLL